jgi:hypothetical protein
MRFIGGLVGAAAAVVLFILLGGGGAFAAPPIAAATRTNAFSSMSTGNVVVPLRNDDTTTLKFKTAAANQTVVITYNAECVVDAERGVRLTIRILVDGSDAQPNVGSDFALCSAVDTDGNTWASNVRQSAVTVPEAGTHVVKVVARLRGGPGSWRLDDSSLVVQRGVRAFATREDAFQKSSTTPVKLPIKQVGGRDLRFQTTGPNEVLKFIYNAECDTAADQPGKSTVIRIAVPDATVFDGMFEMLCHSVDTTGKTWAGAARQYVATIAEAGDHTAAVFGVLNSGPGTWRVDDSSFVVTDKVLAAGSNDSSLLTNNTDELAVTITEDDGTELDFTTTKSNQLVKVTFNANCQVAGPRGRWVGIRIEVDGVQAQPASGYDFALCSSLEQGYYRYGAGFRQSVITIPTPGVHTVRVFAKVSVGPTTWGLGRTSVVVE